MPPKVLVKKQAEEVPEVKEVEVVEVVTEPAEKRFKFLSKIYMVNPYTKTIFSPSEVTEDVKMDSWTECQVAAGLLKEIE